MPSWAWKDMYDLQERLECKPYIDKIGNEYKLNGEVISQKETDISKNNHLISDIEKKLIKPSKKKTKLENKLQKAKLKSTIKYLIKKQNKVLEKILYLENLKNEYIENIKVLSNEIKVQKSQHNKIIYQLKKEIYKIKDFYNEKRLTIKKLSKNIIENSQDSEFLPISRISLFNQEKITGVYVIRNNENQKYYVGQSKDVLRRLKQHFKGTVPNNMIFAEDYYTSDNQKNLFSVKIIPLQTKDELDSTEKSLIEKYDSFNYGYNKTKGNE